MTQDNNGILGKLGSLLGGDKVDQATGTTTASNTQHAFTDDIAGLGTLVQNSGIGKDLLGKLDGLKSLDMSQIQQVLGALGQSSDPQVQSAKHDLEQSKNDSETFVQKLKGYATSISQFLPTILPVLKNILGGTK